jgi:hypothetical protein
VPPAVDEVLVSVTVRSGAGHVDRAYVGLVDGSQVVGVAALDAELLVFGAVLPQLGQGLPGRLPAPF